MNSMLTYEEALITIERLTGDLEAGMLSKKELQDVISKIYRVAHCVVKAHSCYSVHDGWRAEATKLHKQLKENESK